MTRRFCGFCVGKRSLAYCGFRPDAAYHSGELSDGQYEAALAKGEAITAELCTDIEATEVLCQRILSHVNGRIEQGLDLFQKNV